MNFSTKFCWQPNWKILLFVGVFFPLSCGLGFWQLDRAEQKREILAAQQAQQDLPLLQNQTWQQDSANHLRSVELNLTFDPIRYLLIANRLRNGQVGYEVISIAYLSGREEIPLLVNRGWVQASLDRSELPEISQPQELSRVTGYYYCPQPNPMVKQSTDFSGQWPAIVFSLDQRAMEQIFEASARPIACEVRIDSGSPLAFLTGWEIVNQTVEKHLGYAVQWLSMAFALIILALFSNSNLGVFFRSASTKSASTNARSTNNE